jgi:hypothetical protein
MMTLCIECLKDPCDPRCPNAEQPEVIGVCKNCNTDIYDNEEEVYEQSGVGLFCCLDCALLFNEICNYPTEYDD